MSSLFALSPLDGRYADKVNELSSFFSEASYIYYRTYVQVEWLVFLCNDLKLEKTRVIKPTELKKLRNLYKEFNAEQATEVKEIEAITNHDLKAVEYYIKAHLEELRCSDLKEFVHFACTSDDVNNICYALMVNDSMEEVMYDSLEGLFNQILKQSEQYKKIPMLSRTHGQPATPTTMGKEFFNVLKRLEGQMGALLSIEILAKMNGAVGNFNAHLVAYPKVNWVQASEEFIAKLGLSSNLYTTQIEPHDFLAEICDALRRINTVLIDFDRDLWTYISMDYFKQKVKTGEIGSSTMPHKVNPIDFENSEGNLGLANALLSHLSEKLPISRMQRDLSDSTVLRNVGSAFGYCLLGYKSLVKGLSKLEINKDKLAEDLDANWAVLAEPIQTVMRKHGVEKPYEKLKELTRGKKVTAASVAKFIDTLKIPAADKKRLKKLTPAKYIGLAADLVNRGIEELS